MKKSLLISAWVLTLLGVSATLFAQTATGWSLITEMKASIRSFTLASDLNPGTTGLQSYPVAGKETGDMLTAGEWNRVLELLAQGGGGGGKFEINDSTTKTTYHLSYNPTDLWSRSSPTPTASVCPAGGSGWTECKNIDTAAHDFCHVTSITGSSPHVSFAYLGGKRYRLSNAYLNSSSLAPYSSGITVVCYDNIGGGGTGGGTGSSWVSVPLTDTAPFDQSCDYRVKLRAPASWDNLNGVEPMFLAQQVSPTRLVLSQTASWVNHLYSDSKDKWRQNGAINSIVTILEIYKRCDGVSTGTG